MGMRTGGRKPLKSPQNRFFRPLPAHGGRGGGRTRARTRMRAAAGAAQRARRVLNIIFHPLFSPPPPPWSLSPPTPPLFPFPPYPPKTPPPTTTTTPYTRACVLVREGTAGAEAGAPAVKTPGPYAYARATSWRGRKAARPPRIVQNGNTETGVIVQFGNFPFCTTCGKRVRRTYKYVFFGRALFFLPQSKHMRIFAHTE